MKRFLISAAVMGLIAGASAFSVQQNAIAADEQKGYVTVSASANTELQPDVAEINIAVVTTDSRSMQKAVQENKEISDKVYSALKAMINPANGDYIKTRDFVASPMYSYSGSRRSFDKYEVNNSIIVHTKSIDKTGNIIDKAISLGATNVNDLNFSVSNYQAQCNELSGIAAKKARSQADAIAKSVSSSVTGIKSLNVSCSQDSPRTPYRMMAAKNIAGDAAVEQSSVTTIEKGVIKIFANVNASFYLK